MVDFNEKVRVSWGKNGNEKIGNFKYTVLTVMATIMYLFGSGASNMVNGS